MDLLSSTLAFIGDLAGPEMFFVLIIVLVLFGGDKLPGFARGLGKSIREFKKAAAGVEDEFKRALEEDELKSIAASITTPLLDASPIEATPTAPPVTVPPDEPPAAPLAILPPQSPDDPLATPLGIVPPESPEGGPVTPSATTPDSPPASDATKPVPPPNVVPGDNLP